MPKPARIPSNMSSSDLNDLLMKAYGHELFDFAFSLAVVLSKKPLISMDHQIWLMKKEGIPFITRCEKELANLDEIIGRLDRVVEALDDHLTRIEFWESVRAGAQKSFLPQFFPIRTTGRLLDKEAVILENYSLKIVFDTLSEEVEYYQRWVNLLGPKGRNKGRYTLAITIIAALWSRIIRYKRRTDWKNLWALIDWFKTRVNSTDYGRELERYPSEESIYRFRDKFQRRLKKDRLYFFAHNYRSRKLKNIRKPKPLQVRFEPQNPRLYKREGDSIALLVFPDGTSLP